MFFKAFLVNSILLFILFHQILKLRKGADAFTRSGPINQMPKNKEAEAQAVAVLINPEIALRQTLMRFNHPMTEGRSLGEVTEDLNPNLRV